MTTESKFTPGPWKARYSSVIDVEKDEIIAVMTCGSVHRKNELEDYDTARLIAAAPDLFEALDCIDFDDGMIAEALGENLQDKIIAALAKARGES